MLTEHQASYSCCTIGRMSLELNSRASQSIGININTCIRVALAAAKNRWCDAPHKYKQTAMLFEPEQGNQGKPINVRKTQRNEAIPSRARSQRPALLIPKYGSFLGEKKKQKT